MDTLLNAAAAMRRRARAQRLAGVLPLVAVGVATVAAGLLRQFGGPAGLLLWLPAVTFAVIAAGIYLRAKQIGTGIGADGYVFLTIVFVLAAPVLSGLYLGVGILPAFGIGLALLGLRGRDPLLFGAGVGLVALGPLFFDGVFIFHGTADGQRALLLQVLGTVLITLGVIRFYRDRRFAINLVSTDG